MGSLQADTAVIIGVRLPRTATTIFNPKSEQNSPEHVTAERTIVGFGLQARRLVTPRRVDRIRRREKLFQSNCLIRTGGFLEAQMITSAPKKLVGKAEMTVSPLAKSVCVAEIVVSTIDIIASCI